MIITDVKQLEEAVVAVTLEGEMDAFTCVPAREKLHDLIETRAIEVLILDLEGVAFIDSMGLGLLISCLKRLREKNGRLVLSGASPRVEKILKLTQLDRVFERYPSRAEALLSVAPSPK